MKRSTKRDEILQYITVYLQEHGFAPSVRDIAQATHLASTSTAHGHLCRMEKDGLITMTHGVCRTIRLVQQPVQDNGLAVQNNGHTSNTLSPVRQEGA